MNNPLVYPPPQNLGEAEFYAAVSAETQKLYDQMWARFLAQEGPVPNEPPVQ